MLRYLVIAALTSLSACSFVEQKPGSENVTVTDKDAVVSCQSKGKSRVTVLSEIGFADLMDEYVAEKLDMMGKNAAVDQNRGSQYRQKQASFGGDPHGYRHGLRGHQHVQRVYP